MLPLRNGQENMVILKLKAVQLDRKSTAGMAPRIELNTRGVQKIAPEPPTKRFSERIATSVLVKNKK
jgi:hypothetical protein